MKHNISIKDNHCLESILEAISKISKYTRKLKTNYEKILIFLSKEQIDFSDFDAFVLPGGFHSHGFDEAYSEELHKIAREFHKQNKPVATLCVGVLPVSDAGLLKGKKATTYNLSRFHDNPDRLQNGGAIYTGSKVEFDNNIISSAGPASSLAVAFKLVELLTGKENLKEVKKLMMA